LGRCFEGMDRGCEDHGGSGSAEGKKRRRGQRISLNLSWYLFYGRKLGMNRREILITTIGEMSDMLACLAIYEGTAVPKKKLSRITNFDDAIKLR
jgi:hypothetical protein